MYTVHFQFSGQRNTRYIFQFSGHRYTRYIFNFRNNVLHSTFFNFRDNVIHGTFLNFWDTVIYDKLINLLPRVLDPPWLYNCLCRAEGTGGRIPCILDGVGSTQGSVEQDIHAGLVDDP